MGKEKLEKEIKKCQLLKKEIKHIDIKLFDSRPIIESMEEMAFQARNLARAAKIYDKMLSEDEVTIILCLAGSLFSAGLKKVVVDLIKYNMVDVIVSSGAIIVDQDFFEALGFRHYHGTPYSDDEMLRRMNIDRIYDTFIDENELRVCDMTVARIADSLPPHPYSSRQFIKAMGEYLYKNRPATESVVLECYKRNIPIFVPAFSDCSAGFGLIYHQQKRGKEPRLSIDSAKDFLELTRIKIKATDTGLVMVGGGVPKNFVQDTTVAADVLGHQVNMHKYAIQITALKEAHSWGKIGGGFEQMVFCEATIAFPLLASYVYHRGSWKGRKPKCYNSFLDEVES